MEIFPDPGTRAKMSISARIIGQVRCFLLFKFKIKTNLNFINLSKYSVAIIKLDLLKKQRNRLKLRTSKQKKLLF